MARYKQFLANLIVHKPTGCIKLYSIGVKKICQYIQQFPSNKSVNKLFLSKMIVNKPTGLTGHYLCGTCGRRT